MSPWLHLILNVTKFILGVGCTTLLIVFLLNRWRPYKGGKND